jgi:hypothetical protein
MGSEWQTLVVDGVHRSRRTGNGKQCSVVVVVVVERNNNKTGFVELNTMWPTGNGRVYINNDAREKE